MTTPIVLLVLLVGCDAPTPTETSPPTLESQTLLTLQRFYEDDASEQLDTLIDLVADEVGEDAGGFYFDALEPEDVEMFEHSDAAIWEHTTGCAVFSKMRGTVADYAKSVPEPDQSFPDPSYQLWTREITGGTEADFLAGGDLDTWNQIEKDGVGFSVAYGMHKDYRWHGDTLAMISLVPEGEQPADAFSTELVVGFTIELWTPIDGTMVWYNGSWTEIESPLDEDAVEIEGWLDLLIAGTIDYFEGTETHVMGEEVVE
ncbi:hypothetical protein LBMAG42_44340 [Deltaproteobacteria bacterium]|nr:hypothetical protein LBMAG42_44340 [Deltaproteobacteria bacterium]